MDGVVILEQKGQIEDLELIGTEQCRSSKASRRAARRANVMRSSLCRSRMRGPSIAPA
jgi:hypothetical protein